MPVNAQQSPPPSANPTSAFDGTFSSGPRKKVNIAMRDRIAHQPNQIAEGGRIAIGAPLF
jgi:hypothetical protein